MRLAALAGLALALSGCGGSTNLTSGQPCSITLSGAVTGTFACNAVSGGYQTSNSQGAVAASVGGATAITIGIAFPGDLHTGTFKDTDAGVQSALSVQTGTGSNNFWAAAAGTGGAKTGSYTLTITDTGLRVPGQGGAAYPAVHGTLTATLPAVAGSGATGTVSLSATF
jgi:hypothetical protein